MQNSFLRNIPGFSRLIKSSNPKPEIEQQSVISNIPQVPINTVPEPTYLQDCYLFPFSDKISLLLQSLGCEIVEKMQHSTSGKDFLLLKLSDSIRVDNDRLPRSGEFTGTSVGNVACLLFTEDGRLLAFSDGLHGEVVGHIGHSWEKVADFINEAGKVIPIPQEVVELGKNFNGHPLLEKTYELIVSGCTKLGFYSFYSRAHSQFMKTKRGITGDENGSKEVHENAFAEFLEPHFLATKELSQSRLESFLRTIDQALVSRSPEPATYQTPELSI